MDTQSTQFDSHRFVKRLTNAGLSEEVAEILADEHTKLIVPADVATKTDVGTVEAGVRAVRTDMATQAEVDARFDRVGAETDARFDQIRAEMATKEDLRREIAACEARMEQRLRNAILEAKVSLIKWMIATMIVFSGIVIGAVTALQ